MNKYEKYKEIAKEKLLEYGSPITLVQVQGQPKYNEKTNEYENNESRTEGLALQSSFKQFYVDGKNINAGDILFLITIDKVPLSGDSLEFEGKKYTIIDVVTVNPDGKLDILYKVQAR